MTSKLEMPSYTADRLAENSERSTPMPRTDPSPPGWGSTASSGTTAAMTVVGSGRQGEGSSSENRSPMAGSSFESAAESPGPRGIEGCESSRAGRPRHNGPSVIVVRVSRPQRNHNTEIWCLCSPERGIERGFLKGQES